jgi:Complex I intermediate-associated protein 30 (CIA30)
MLLLAVGPEAQERGGPLVVADFDGGKPETNAGLALWIYCDEQLGGTSDARVTLINPGAGKSRGAVRLSFRVTDDFRMAFASVWAMVGPEGLATDLSAYKGVRFYARSKDALAFTAGLVRFDRQIKRYTTPVTLEADWSLVELTFDKFQQVPVPGAAVDASPLDPKDVTSFGIGVAPKLRGHFDIEIDRIEFYR